MPLYIVPTPIGNLADITLRALEVLREADVIACEDTRRTGNLLRYHSIEGKSLVSYHEHNERRRSEQLREDLASGRTVALVSDAGTPLISDPGFRLVRAAQEVGVEVIPLPGPCAALTALSGSGLPVHRFCFLGFPPKGPVKLRRLLEAERNNDGSLVLYESPQRLTKLLDAIVEVFGADRQVAIARELTKIHEQIQRDCVGELAEAWRSAASIKGEFVVVIGPEGFLP
jgi:16S rRNA (cytidine1402-2'-O)-methyltransferase